MTVDSIAVASTGPAATTKTDAQIAQVIVDLSSGKITAEELTRQLAGGNAPPVADPNSLEALVAKAYVDINPVELAPWTGNLSYRGGINWDSLFSRAASDSSLRNKLQSLSQWQAGTVGTNANVYRRAMTFGEIPSNMVDSIALQAGSNKSARALAMSDCTQTYFLVQKVVPLAVAARFTEDPVYLAKVIEILREVALYVPLQRPGWSLGTASATMSAEGDGPNMATAWGVSAIVDILDILGPLVPTDLRTVLQNNLRNEVYLIVKAWALKLPWYVQSRSVMSNQWTDPNVAMIKACLYLGDPALLPAYNLGVENLAATLRISQSDGAFLEGFTYAQMSGGSMVSIIGNIHANNDLRCDQYPFLSKFWRWLLQMQMPGGHLVNCADSNLSKFPSWSISSPLSSVVDAAFASGDPNALAAVKFAFPNSDDSLSGLQYFDASSRISTPQSWPLPLFDFFPSQQLLVWRSAYEPPSKPQSALGVWIKGGTLSEKSHGHRDQGQLSVYKGTRAILLDCGTPNDYGDPQLNSVFASAAGHNIMQIGELAPRVLPVNAPMQVISLDVNGGRVLLDVTNASTEATKCTREIWWDRLGGFSIDDTVELRSPIAQGTEFYRFHTGSLNPLTIHGQGTEWTATWADATMSFFSDTPILVEQIPWRDQVLDSQSHQVLVVRVIGQASRLRLQTTLNVQ
ncbi:MAG: heparinase II/III family protein [Planctomycetota bacterium]|nr:heparinase II/III family protein [Planctomycetota bacterium]